jgi:hypothetical protein
MGFIKGLFYEKLGCNICEASIRKGKGHTVSGTIAEKMIREHYDRIIAKYRASGLSEMVSLCNSNMRMTLEMSEYIICDKCLAEFEQAKLTNPSDASEGKRQARCRNLFDAGNYGGIQYWCENSSSPGVLGQGSRIPLSDGNHISRYCMGTFAQCPLYMKKH